MTVFDQFRRAAATYPENEFLHIPRQAACAYRDSALTWHYGETLGRVREAADAYRSAGYGAGQRVALMLDNRAEFFLHFLTLNGLGVSIVPVGSSLARGEMEYALSHSDAILLVSLPEYQDVAREAAGRVPVVTCNSMNELPAATLPAQPATPGDATEAALLYTSGTTARPKACMLSNEYFQCMGEWYRTLGGYCVLEPGRERLLTPLPLVHMNALACSTMGMIMTGGCLIQLDRFHASTWWATVRESRATCLHYLGIMPAVLLNLPPAPGENLHGQVKFGFGAGADPRHQERFEERFGFPLIEGWAMTETGTEVCIAAQQEPRHPGQRCVGRPTGPMEFRLVDEGGQDVPPGEPGELLVRVRGDNPRRGFFSGYYKDPEATEQAWEGGWFHTGDVLRVGPDGSFFFVDRRKNIIRRSGENIAAVEVESILYRHPRIAACAVAPVPDPVRGEEVAALVVLGEGTGSSAALATELFDFCREQLSYYKVPAYYIFVPALPMTTSQKLRRGEMRKLAEARVQQGECADLRERKRNPGKVR